MKGRERETFQITEIRVLARAKSNWHQALAISTHIHIHTHTHTHVRVLLSFVALSCTLYSTRPAGSRTKRAREKPTLLSASAFKIFVFPTFLMEMRSLLMKKVCGNLPCIDTRTRQLLQPGCERGKNNKTELASSFSLSGIRKTRRKTNIATKERSAENKK